MFVVVEWELGDGIRGVYVGSCVTARMKRMKRMKRMNEWVLTLSFGVKCQSGYYPFSPSNLSVT